MYIQYYRGIYKYLLLKWCKTYFIGIQIACLFYSQLEKRKRLEGEGINTEVVDDVTQRRPDSSPQDPEGVWDPWVDNFTLVRKGNSRKSPKGGKCKGKEAFCLLGRTGLEARWTWVPMATLSKSAVQLCMGHVSPRGLWSLSVTMSTLWVSWEDWSVAEMPGTYSRHLCIVTASILEKNLNRKRNNR